MKIEDDAGAIPSDAWTTNFPPLEPVLAKDIASEGRNIPKGTSLSDVHELPGEARGHFVAFANIWGMRVKLHLIASDITARRNA